MTNIPLEHLPAFAVHDSQITPQTLNRRRLSESKPGYQYTVYFHTLFTWKAVTGIFEGGVNIDNQKYPSQPGLRIGLYNGVVETGAKHRSRTSLR